MCVNDIQTKFHFGTVTNNRRSETEAQQAKLVHNIKRSPVFGEFGPSFFRRPWMVLGVTVNVDNNSFQRHAILQYHKKMIIYVVVIHTQHLFDNIC